jgi:hypothetical protein
VANPFFVCVAALNCVFRVKHASLSVGPATGGGALLESSEAGGFAEGGIERQADLSEHLLAIDGVDMMEEPAVLSWFHIGFSVRLVSQHLS